MKHWIRFIKGIVVGIGGVAPGLSGSILLIIFGLYQQTLDTLSSLFRNFKEKLRFLLPLVAGMVLGVILFSNLIDFFMTSHPVPTRFCFLGLILGTLPMVWKDVRKNGFSPWYYGLIVLAAGLGIWFFTANPHAFPQVTDPNLLQCLVLGVAVAATAIIPGVDPAVFLTTLGLYEADVGALADLRLSILLPMALGLAFGAVLISGGMSFLFRHAYTATYSIIFGIFLSMIPNMLPENGWTSCTPLCICLLAAGFCLSYYLGDITGNNCRIRKLLSRKREG